MSQADKFSTVEVQKRKIKDMNAELLHKNLLVGHLRAEIDQLKAQLIDQGQRFNDQSQKVRDLEFKCEGLEKRIYSALMLLQRNQLYIPALAMEQIGKVLRGES